MAPIDLKLGQNAFQVIPELSLFDDFSVTIIVSWPGHMCPGQDKMTETEKSEIFSIVDVKK